MGNKTRLTFQIRFSFALNTLIWEIFLKGITFLELEVNS